MRCEALCRGFKTLRTECARDPCLTKDMCKVLNPSITDCSTWCCINRSIYAFFIVFFVCIGIFTLCIGHYLNRLHKKNMNTGTVMETGEVIEMKNLLEVEGSVTPYRPKRNTKVDPQILKILEANDNQ
ncbi:unnamed protein product [Phytomonas sp. Hart1]|nr:unnamed protein product [Phytomonas sp. Hart1]|eukprot:CCW67817.1 unnamed protein product [Phytomonas sp. isolate Hart1]